MSVVVSVPPSRPSNRPPSPSRPRLESGFHPKPDEFAGLERLDRPELDEDYEATHERHTPAPESPRRVA